MTEKCEFLQLAGIKKRKGAFIPCREAAYLNHATGADGVKIAVKRKGRARSRFI